MAKGEKDKADEQAVRPKILTEWLPVDLKPDEVMVRAKELAQTQQARDDAQRRLDSAVATAKAAKEEIGEEIERLDAKSRQLAEAVRNERENRMVEVFLEFDYQAGAVYTRRADTKAKVGTRGMTEAERQRPLPFNPPRKVESKAAEAKA